MENDNVSQRGSDMFNNIMQISNQGLLFVDKSIIITRVFKGQYNTLATSRLPFKRRLFELPIDCFNTSMILYFELN